MDIDEKEFTDQRIRMHKRARNAHILVGLAWLGMSGFALKDSFNDGRTPNEIKERRGAALVFAGGAAYSGTKVAKEAGYLKRLRELQQG